MNSSASPSCMRAMTALGADWWNDSGIPAEVAEAVTLGAVGGTSNPVIVAQAVQNNPELCQPLLEQLITDHPTATEDELAWRLIHRLGTDAAAQLRPVYEGGQVQDLRLYSKRLSLTQAARIHQIPELNAALDLRPMTEHHDEYERLIGHPYEPPTYSPIFHGSIHPTLSKALQGAPDAVDPSAEPARFFVGISNLTGR